ncbi:MAG: tetratricopeptide repeat protein [Euryarchaeota archaeon]|nr:tetratricopeptide repeat protein [Euryarchaeota archaeon]
MDDYHKLLHEERGIPLLRVELKTELEKLIKKDPDFFDSYLTLFQILQSEGRPSEAMELLDEAYRRAINLITDKKGEWPDLLEWGWLENRHIIRTILNKAISLWKAGKTDDALDIFRKLLKSNPGDNVGARNYILAIRMKMSFKKFEKRFNKGGYYDSSLTNWFEKNYRKFPDEFEWWDKATENTDSL